MTTNTNGVATRVRQSLAAQIVGLAVFVGICFAVMALSGAATAQSVNDWYRTLNKPTWTPASYWFGIVWPILYLLMAISAWLLWHRHRRSHSAFPLSLFFLQLFLNLAWSFLFFALKSPFLGLIDIALLLAAIVATIVSFWPLHRGAALLLLPYFAWVSFATCLNFALWQMNR